MTPGREATPRRATQEAQRAAPCHDDGRPRRYTSCRGGRRGHLTERESLMSDELGYIIGAVLAALILAAGVLAAHAHVLPITNY